MVRGIDVFREHFAKHTDQFVLIGGTAATLAMETENPEDVRFPAMLELFCRSPDGIRLAEGSRLTPIPIDEVIASLSAIVLDDAYYAFIIDGRRNIDQLSWIGAEQLIPLKARAWNDLTTRKVNGDSIDTKDIRKHANDAVRLSQLLAPDSRIELTAKIAADLNQFLDGVAVDGTYDPKSIQIPATLAEILARIARAYGLQRAEA